MPRLTRRQIAQLLAVAAVLANVVVFALVQVERGTLEEQETVLADLQRELRTPRGRNNPAVLQRDLEEAQKKATDASAALPGKVDVIALHNHIVRAAVTNLVQLTNVTLQPPATRDLAAGKYPVVDLTVEGQGDLPRLQGFLDQVGQGLYPTIILESLSINRVQESWTVKFHTVVLSKPG